MKKILLLALICATFAACNEIVDDNNNKVDEPTAEFKIEVNNELLTAYSVTFDIRPANQTAPYYYDIVSKTRLSQVDVATIRKEIYEGAQKMSEMTGTPVEEVVDSFLSTGDQLDILSNAGYKGEVDYCIYAFYWDAGDDAELTLCEFRTPAEVASTESVEVNFEVVDSYAMNVTCNPSSGVTDYWYYFNETAKVEQMLASLEDDIAYKSYHAMNVGTRQQGVKVFEQKGLKPETEYTVLIMAIDNKHNRLLMEAKQATPKTNEKVRVESELFEDLLGEWSGVQTITDLYNPAEECHFDVTIVGSVEGYPYDYRADNQIVALVDGWCHIEYYGVDGLIAEGIENPEEKWGPKWLLNIAEGDVVTIDGQVRNNTVGWLFFGNCYTLNAKADGSMIHTDTDLEVVVSPDRNTITIKSPAHLVGCYPSLAYPFEGFGWMGYFIGTSDIVLTRK